MKRTRYNMYMWELIVVIKGIQSCNLNPWFRISTRRESNVSYFDIIMIGLLAQIRKKLLLIKIELELQGVELWCYNTTFNNISILSWQSVLLVEDTGKKPTDLLEVTDKL